MPVSITKLEELKVPLKMRVRDFLAKDPSHAFSLAELYTALERGVSPTTEGTAYAMFLLSMLPAPVQEVKLAPIRAALVDLVNEQMVRKYDYNSEAYYAIGTDTAS